MEWQQLIGFVNLVKHESFTRAADASFRTQSALSQQVKKLEDELQIKLINRHSRKQFTLTSAGERFYEFASRVIGEHQSLIDDISAIKGMSRGKLRLAAPFTTLYHLFPGQFESFIKEYPYVDITILDRQQSKVLGLLKRGAIDIGVALESQVPGELEARRWKKVEIVLIVPLKHPLIKLKKASLRDIARYPLILPPKGAQSRAAIEELLGKQNIDYRVIMESGNVELSSRYVESNLGVAFGTVAMNLDLLKARRIQFIPLKHLFRPDYLSLVNQRNTEVPAYMSAFIEQILKS